MLDKVYFSAFMSQSSGCTYFSETDSCKSSCKFGRNEELIMTSYFIPSPIVSIMFVKLSKWQVPPDGFIMRLESPWVDMLGVPVRSVNSVYWLLAVSWMPDQASLPVQSKWVLDVNEEKVLECHRSVSEDCHCNWPNVLSRRRHRPSRVSLPKCFLFFSSGKDTKTFFSRSVMKHSEIRPLDRPRKKCVTQRTLGRLLIFTQSWSFWWEKNSAL